MKLIDIFILHATLPPQENIMENEQQNYLVQYAAHMIAAELGLTEKAEVSDLTAFLECAAENYNDLLCRNGVETRFENTCFQLAKAQAFPRNNVESNEKSILLQKFNIEGLSTFSKTTPPVYKTNAVSKLQETLAKPSEEQRGLLGILDKSVELAYEERYTLKFK